MEHIAVILAENFKVSQYDDRDDAPYKSDWDLLFWCNDFAGTMRGLLEGRDYAHFTLSFNGQHDPERREKIYNRILRILELFSDDGNLRVTVQYDAMMDDARIKRDAKLAAPRIIGQNCIYEGMEGRVEANGDSLFFRRKRARKHVYCLTDAQILSISWQLSPPEEDSI